MILQVYTVRLDDVQFMVLNDPKIKVMYIRRKFRIKE